MWGVRTRVAESEEWEESRWRASRRLEKEPKERDWTWGILSVSVSAPDPAPGSALWPWPGLEKERGGRRGERAGIVGAEFDDVCCTFCVICYALCCYE